MRLDKTQGLSYQLELFVRVRVYVFGVCPSFEVLMVMVTVPKEDISIDEVRVATAYPEVSPVNAILTPSGAVALMLMADILTASEGILTFMVPEAKTLLLTIAPPEAV